MDIRFVKIHSKHIISCCHNCGVDACECLSGGRRTCVGCTYLEYFSVLRYDFYVGKSVGFLKKAFPHAVRIVALLQLWYDVYPWGLGFIVNGSSSVGRHPCKFFSTQFSSHHPVVSFSAIYNSKRFQRWSRHFGPILFRGWEHIACCGH